MALPWNLHGYGEGSQEAPRPDEQHYLSFLLEDFSES